jgi:hypothetical protein
MIYIQCADKLAEEFRKQKQAGYLRSLLVIWRHRNKSNIEHMTASVLLHPKFEFIDYEPCTLKKIDEGNA